MHQNIINIGRNDYGLDNVSCSVYPWRNINVYDVHAAKQEEPVNKVRFYVKAVEDEGLHRSTAM